MNVERKKNKHYVIDKNVRLEFSLNYSEAKVLPNKNNYTLYTKELFL